MAWPGVAILVAPFWRRRHRIPFAPFGFYQLIRWTVPAPASIVFMHVGFIGLIDTIPFRRARQLNR